MRIAQLVSNYHSIPSGSNGAMCQVVDQLTGGLVERGHDVTLFASGDSVTSAKLVAVTEVKTSDLGLSDTLISNYNHALAANCYEKAPEFDIIHSHFSVVSAFYAKLVETPTVQTVHLPISDNLRTILGHYRDLNFVSFSLSQRRQMPDLNWIANIYHGVDTELFAYNDSPKDYFLFVGPLTEQGAPHLAIEAAQAAGVKLIIAGRSDTNDNYWHEIIEPTIDDQRVQFVGYVANHAKVELLREAKAILFPAQWDEPFGLALTEALSCGTPVIGFSRGMVPEIVQDGDTGFIVRDVSQMTAAIGSIHRINRSACRDRAEKLFSHHKMVDGYEHVYQRIVAKN
ncbi:MAG: glycosyltransferase family 4 protein [Patescibacteria group bacterium]